MNIDKENLKGLVLNGALPPIVSVLMSEIERLEGLLSVDQETIARHQGQIASHISESLNLKIENEDLRAELAGLRTGYDAQNNVIAGLSKDAYRYRELRDNGYLDSWADVHICDEHRRPEMIDSGIDAAMWPKGVPIHG